MGHTLILAAAFGFILLNVFEPPEAAVASFIVQLFGAALLIASLSYLRQQRTWQQLMTVAIVVAVVLCVVAGLVAGWGGRMITGIACVMALVVAAPAFVPWGAVPQSILALVGMATILMNREMVSQLENVAEISAVSLAGRSLFLIAFTLAFTAYLAFVLHRSRHLTAANDLQRLLALERVQGLNEDLEKRVAERTHELSVALRELRTFTYSASHDLKSPLRAINAYSQALAENLEGELEDEDRDCLDRIGAASERMEALIEALLGLSRVAQTKLEVQPIDLAAVARSIAEELDAANPEHAARWMIDTELRAQADPALIHIVLANLQGNAWKFSRGIEGARIEVGSSVADGGRAFFVRDNGPGFDMSYAKGIFEPFRRLESGDQGVEGTGIGLTTVQRIIERHGGRVWAESKLGEGSTFFFSLPGNGEFGHPFESRGGRDPDRSDDDDAGSPARAARAVLAAAA